MGRHILAHVRAMVTGVALLACAAPLPASETKPARRANDAVAATTILGTAWRADNTPIPEARLRLRNVSSGRADATTIANGRGQFTFTSMEPGTYVIELVDEDGKILALSKVVTLGPGETVATFVRLTARAPWFTGFFSNIATSALTAASSLGVTTLGSDGQPVSAAPGHGQ